MLANTARAATAAEMDRDVKTRLRKLYASNPSNRDGRTEREGRF